MEWRRAKREVTQKPSKIKVFQGGERRFKCSNQMVQILLIGLSKMKNEK